MRRRYLEACVYMCIHIIYIYVYVCIHIYMDTHTYIYIDMFVVARGAGTWRRRRRGRPQSSGRWQGPSRALTGDGTGGYSRGTGGYSRSVRLRFAQRPPRTPRSARSRTDVQEEESAARSGLDAALKHERAAKARFSRYSQLDFFFKPPFPGRQTALIRSDFAGRFPSDGGWAFPAVSFRICTLSRSRLPARC